MKDWVAGQELFTDSTRLKANSNKNKYTNKMTTVQASAYLDMRDGDIALEREKEGKNLLKSRASETKTKNIKISTTDPESGFMTRDNNPQGLLYLDHRIVDGMHGIILMPLPIISMTLSHILEPFNLNPIAVGLMEITLPLQP